MSFSVFTFGDFDGVFVGDFAADFAAEAIFAALTTDLGLGAIFFFGVVLKNDS